MKNDILEQIYIRHLEEYDPSPEYRVLCERLDKLWADAGQALGEEGVRRLQDCESDIYLRSNLAWFREGWRMGTLLVLDLLAPRQ